MEVKKICSNFWCKAHFSFNKSEKEDPKQCPKCRSFETELSGGITTSEKKYEGSRIDNTPHEINIKINKFF
jgi:Zn finger protein HypA/HybF involved in hydrogenase expression